LCPFGSTSIGTRSEISSLNPRIPTTLVRLLVSKRMRFKPDSLRIWAPIP
jgi:hypothetical protein